MRVARLELLRVWRSRRDATGTSAVEEASSAGAPTLLLEIVDSTTGDRIPARFTVHVDGEPYFPDALGDHGVRFYSVHDAKDERLVVTYARGTGELKLALPQGAEAVEVHAAKGFEYVPASARADVRNRRATLRIELLRWTDSRKKGSKWWDSADRSATGPDPSRLIFSRISMN